jgi:hypothetical protein
MLIWDTNPRSPESFSPIGLRMAEKFQFLSVTDNRLQQQTTHMNRRKAGKTIVRCDFPIATDKNLFSVIGHFGAIWVLSNGLKKIHKGRQIVGMYGSMSMLEKWPLTKSLNLLLQEKWSKNSQKKGLICCFWSL